MRCCYYCRKEEGSKHDTLCPYYLGLVNAGYSLKVDMRTGFVIDTNGCPYKEWGRDGSAHCEGCVQCEQHFDV